MPIRDAARSDLPHLFSIYNASIPGRMASADLVPVTVADLQAWFDDFRPDHRPLWI